VTRPSPVPESPFTGAVRTARAGRHARAIEQIERALREVAPADPSQAAAVEALAHVARLAEAAGDAAQAESALEAALRLRPGYPDLHYRRARLLRDLGRHAEARRALDRALSLNPSYAAARLERALLDAADGFIGEALSSLRALACEAAVEKPAVFEAGLESLERADWEEAGALFTRALALDEPADGGTLERVHALLETGDAAGAAETLQALLPGRESWPDLHYLLGSAELQRGHFDDALASLARALELNPSFHGARVQFARALEAVGAMMQAGEQVALVLQHDPKHPQALELHERWTARARPPTRGDSTRRES
jgi:tetratricopeptide (TPR) repeat protein